MNTDVRYFKNALDVGCKQTHHMKQHSFRTLLFFAFISLTTGCTKDKQDGQGSFSAKINGKDMLPCVPTLTNGGPIKTNSYFYSSTHGSISVSASNRCERSYTYGKYIVVSFDSVILAENTTYKFGNGYNAVNGQVRCIYSEDLNDYVSDSTLSGNITIRKFDPVSRIISASFEATLKEKNSGQLLTLTQGNFDLKY